MTKRHSPNLSLHRETVRELSTEALAGVEGGCNCSDICPVLNLISVALGVAGFSCAFTLN